MNGMTDLKIQKQKRIMKMTFSQYVNIMVLIVKMWNMNPIVELAVEVVVFVIKIINEIVRKNKSETGEDRNISTLFFKKGYF